MSKGKWNKKVAKEKEVPEEPVVEVEEPIKATQTEEKEVVQKVAFKSNLKIKTRLTLKESPTTLKGGGFMFHCEESGENLIVTNFEIEKKIAESKLTDWTERMTKVLEYQGKLKK